MEFRKYCDKDAIEIIKWTKNEREFRLWSADRYQDYPIKPSDITNNYIKCQEIGNFYPFTLVDDGKVIGHITLRNPDNNINIVRLGFIIVDSNIRGKGYGKKLINEAINYAKNVLKAKEINLGVFTNNNQAFECYKKSGFKVVDITKNVYCFHGEYWDEYEMKLF